MLCSICVFYCKVPLLLLFFFLAVDPEEISINGHPNLASLPISSLVHQSNF